MPQILTNNWESRSPSSPSSNIRVHTGNIRVRTTKIRVHTTGIQVHTNTRSWNHTFVCARNGIGPREKRGHHLLVNYPQGFHFWSVSDLYMYFIPAKRKTGVFWNDLLLQGETWPTLFLEDRNYPQISSSINEQCQSGTQGFALIFILIYFN